MIFWNKFCGFIWIFLLIASFSDAQNQQPARLCSNFLLQENNLQNSESIIHFAIPFYKLNEFKNTSQPVPENFYTKNMGFFCKQELVIEKAVKIPFRFRLGSLQQCNYYEGKKQ